MRINWNELDAVKISEPHMKVLFQIMDTEDAKQLFAHMEKYAMLPEEVQCALGYMRCLLESGMGGFYSAYDKYSIDMLRYTFGHVPFMRLPLRFIGWGGEHNEIGPAYEIDGRCQISENSKIFYTDDDIQGSADEAEELARYIAQASSGIVDVRTEQLEQLSARRVACHEQRYNRRNGRILSAYRATAASRPAASAPESIPCDRGDSAW